MDKQCNTCEIDEAAVEAQIVKAATMSASQIDAILAKINGTNDLHLVYGHQAATIREVGRRLREQREMTA